jgi:hypothetical protein
MSFFSNLPDNHCLEVMVADSPLSTDKANACIYPSFARYITTQKSGRATQMNEAARMTKGEILVFLHADATPPTTFIRDISAALHNGKVFGFFSYKFYPSSFLLSINAWFTNWDGFFAGGGDQIHFMTRKLFDEMRGYDEKFSIMEDFEFVQRVKQAKKPIAIIQNKATVSSRKYYNNSWLKVNVLNLVAFSMFKWKVSPLTIKQFYSKFLKGV